jgi:hypothetical protein
MRDHWYCGNIPQDHWMIKEKILKFEGKRKDKTKVGPIRETFVKKRQVFEKTRQNVKAGSHNQR